MPKWTVPAALLLLIALSGIAPALGGAPQTVLPIYAGPELDYQPAPLRVLPGGQVLVVFERIDPASFMGDLHVALSTDNGATWSAPSPALTSPLNERHPAVVQLGPNSFALFYLLALDGNGNGSRLYRATSADGLSWTQQGALDLGWSTPGELNPNVIREADGTLTLTYQRSGIGYIARSTDGGSTWDTLQTVVNSSARLPRLAKRESDGLYLVSYQKSIGGNTMGIYAKTSYDPYDWNVPEVALSALINSHDSQPIVLEDGTLAVVYAKTPVSYFDLFYRTSPDGAAWSDEVQVTNDPLHYDTQPHPLLHGTPGHILLTWSHQVSTDPYVDHDVYLNTDLLIPAELGVSAKTVAPAAVVPAGLLTYTLVLANAGPGPTTARLADPLPERAAYAGGLWASSGDYGYDAGRNLITWTGMISAYAGVTVTFRAAAAPDLGDGEVITNAAVLTDAAGLPYLLEAAATGDALPPYSAITDPTDGQLISETAGLVSGVAGDTVSAIAAVSVSVDGGPWQLAVGGESWSWSWAGLTDGAHNLRSRAVDAAGHVEEPGPGITITVDTVPPEVLAVLPPAGAGEVPLAAALVVTLSEAILTDTLAYSITPDPGGWAAAWNAPATAVTLTHDDFAPGQAYTVTVRHAHDRARNPLAPVSWSFSTLPPPCAPVAVLSFTNVLSDCQVTFGAELSGTAPFAFLWDFGFAISTATHPLVDFGASGTYPYTLTVSNCGAYSDTAGGVVTVTCALPCAPPAGANLVLAPSAPLVHATVHFTGSVLSGTVPLTYSWAFGDGDTAAGPHAGHAYGASGAFTVTLEVRNACGTAARARAIRIAPYRAYLPLVLR